MGDIMGTPILCLKVDIMGRSRKSRSAVSRLSRKREIILRSVPAGEEGIMAPGIGQTLGVMHDYEAFSRRVAASSNKSLHNGSVKAL
jgi:hypothetical protein